MNYAVLDLLYQWIDLLWIPVGLVTVHKGQRLLTTGFILVCILTLRTQIELMGSIDRDGGLLGFWNAGLYERGLVIYGFLIALFLILAHFSRNTKGVIFLAASLSIYILGFCVSMLAMIF